MFPTESAKRAERRHHKYRMRQKARRIYCEKWGVDPHKADKWADNLALCSKSCCGNPRKWRKEKTLQEIIADKKFNEYKKDSN